MQDEVVVHQLNNGGTSGRKLYTASWCSVFLRALWITDPTRYFPRTRIHKRQNLVRQHCANLALGLLGCVLYASGLMDCPVLYYYYRTALCANATSDDSDSEALWNE